MIYFIIKHPVVTEVSVESFSLLSIIVFSTVVSDKSSVYC